jgi:hypothetical protein
VSDSTLPRVPHVDEATMCRWFAYISPTEDCLLEDVLIDPVRTVSTTGVELVVHLTGPMVAL